MAKLKFKTGKAEVNFKSELASIRFNVDKNFGVQLNTLNDELSIMCKFKDRVRKPGDSGLERNSYSMEIYSKKLKENEIAVKKETVNSNAMLETKVGLLQLFKSCYYGS